MHAVEIINYLNAKESGISVEQNRQEALEGQYLRQPPQAETQTDTASQQQENPQ